MSQSWIADSVRSGLRFARRNGGKIALFTFAAGSAIVATRYFRRQLSAVNESLEQERAEGARRLRAAFISNSSTVKGLFYGLLPLVGEVLRGSAKLDSSSFLVKLRSKPKDRAEKEALWEQVKLASITHLVSAIYIAALLHSFLRLQVNLLSRYTNSNPDVPVESLPRGAIADATSRRYLDLAGTRILERSRVDTIVANVERVVRANLGDTGLAKRIGTVEVAHLFTNILVALEMERATGGETEPGADSDAGDKDSPFISAQRWLLAGCLSRTQASEHPDGSRDLNFEWLVEESLDLCEVLDFHSLVESQMYAVLTHALSRLGGIVGSNENQVPFANYLAHFDRIAADMFSSENENGDIGGIDETDTSSHGLEKGLAEAEDGQRFAASVFLSGEKDNSNRSSHEDGRYGRTGPMQNGNADAMVTNISSLGDGLGEARESNDMGLMFDIN